MKALLLTEYKVLELTEMVSEVPSGVSSVKLLDPSAVTWPLMPHCNPFSPFVG